MDSDRKGRTMSRRTYSVRVRGAAGLVTLDALGSEEAARRVALDTTREPHASRTFALDVAMHFGGELVECATYQYDGRDVQFLGRPSTENGKGTR